MTNEPDDMPPWRYIENAERHRRRADAKVHGEAQTNLLLASIADSLLAIAKMMGRQRA